MFNALNNFTYARAQPLTQKNNSYLNRSKNKNEIGNSLGKTSGILKKQNMKTMCQNDNYRTFNRSNSDYQLGPNNFSKTTSSFYKDFQENKKFHHQSITVQSLNQKIIRLTQRVLSNQQQIFYLKSTQDKLVPDLNIADFKQLMEQHRLQLKKNSNYTIQIEELKQNLSILRQQINKSVKKRQFQIQKINLRQKDIKNDQTQPINQKALQFLQKNKTRNKDSLFVLQQDFKIQIIQIQNYCQQLQSKLMKQISSLKNKNYGEKYNSGQFIKSNCVFKSMPIKFVIQQRIKQIGLKGQKQNEYKISQTIYYIDNQGFLLDQSSRYILDFNNKQIKLTNKEIKLLQDVSILK